MDEVIIIGTGVFGLSTSDHICEGYPRTKQTIISRPSPLAPSDDNGKVVRIDYNNQDRMAEAEEAQRQWKSKENFAEFYHPIGRVVIYDNDSTLQEINRARGLLGLPERQLRSSTLMKEQFETTTASESQVYVHNSDDAIVDWEPCISKARERASAACTNSSGSFYTCGVASLAHDGNRVTEIVLQNGGIIKTSTAQIVLAPGPWFAEMLVTSRIRPPPSGRLPIATGLFSYHVQLSSEQAIYLRNRPILSHEGKVDFLPPANIRSTIGKLTWIEPFTNLRGSELSRVEDLSKSALAKSHMAKAIEWVRKNLSPILRGARIISTLCQWDGVTETQDPLVARHPQLQNLVCAAAGSFNRAKDLPTIGSVIVNVLAGQPVSGRYSWDPEVKYNHRDQPRLVSGGDFAAMEEQARKNGFLVGDQSGLAVI